MLHYLWPFLLNKNLGSIGEAQLTVDCFCIWTFFPSNYCFCKLLISFIFLEEPTVMTRCFKYLLHTCFIANFYRHSFTMQRKTLYHIRTSISFVETCQAKGAFTNYVYKRREVGGPKILTFFIVYTIKNVNGRG